MKEANDNNIKECLTDLRQELDNTGIKFEPSFTELIERTRILEAKAGRFRSLEETEYMVARNFLRSIKSVT